MNGQCIRVTDGVLLTGSALEVAVYAVDLAQRLRARNGQPPLRQLALLREALSPQETALDGGRQALLSPRGHADSPEEPTGEAERMTTDEAAALIGCSTRSARRLAPGLGGQLVGGRWLLDRRAVAEHNEGKQRT